MDQARIHNSDHDMGPADTAPLSSLAEPLQLVRYQVGEEYKAHCDFGYPDPTRPYQPTRFATLLLYLNDVPRGGETSFPLWSNAETGGRLEVAPQAGKAALFYMQVSE
jgi:prolyl 4-hydroxylase